MTKSSRAQRGICSWGSRLSSALAIAILVPLLSAHIGSPNVFFIGKAGAYDVSVVVRPPEVVPGVAHVTVRVENVRKVSIRPVFYRAGSKGAPSADEMRRVEGTAATYEGSLWLMARGSYSVDVIVEGAQGSGNVMVPVASIATGTLRMNPLLGAGLAVFALVLVAGLVNIVYKAAGESLLGAGDEMETPHRSRARRVAAFAIPVVALAIFGGARWWGDVDREYQDTIYKPAPLEIAIVDGGLRVRADDPLYLPNGKRSRYMPDHGKLMHLFLVRADDARAFAHLHPMPQDTSATPEMRTLVPPLPAGRYHAYGDVVNETGWERTFVGTFEMRADWKATYHLKPDPDDAWFIGDAATGSEFRLADGSTMRVDLGSTGIKAGDELTIRATVTDAAGKPARLEPYLGMNGHGVVARLDGQVYVHLHPMGTVTMAAQDAFAVRDRGDTTSSGQLVLPDHGAHVATPAAAPSSSVSFPYAFPKAGSYRLFVQIKHNGRILTGAFAVNVAEAAPPSN